MALAGCSWATDLRRRVDSTVSVHDNILGRITGLEKQVQRLLCPNETVRRFVESCQQGKSSASGLECSVENVEDVLKQMASFRHVVTYYRPKAPVDKPPPKRMHYLKALAATYTRSERTRLLVVALPYSARNTDIAKSTDHDDADRLARHARDFFRDQVFAKSRASDEPPLLTLDPYTIGCSQRSEILQSYRSITEDRPIDDEPKEGERRTVVWTFLLDC